MTTQILTVKQEYTTLDLLLYRQFKVETPGQVEDAYARNPGLAALGEFLPVGTQVTVNVEDAPASTTILRLWG